MEATPEQSAEGLAIVRVLSAVLDRLVGANATTARADPGQVTKFHAMKAPGIGIQQYLERIQKYASCSNECFILALIYIDRLIQRNNFLLTELNVHRVVITAVLLAAKFFDDAYYNNAYYAKVGGVLVSEMNGLEVDFLFRINFSLHVAPDVFQKYRAQLLSQAVPAENVSPVHAPLVHPAATVVAAPPQPQLAPAPVTQFVNHGAGMHHHVHGNMIMETNQITPSPPPTDTGRLVEELVYQQQQADVTMMASSIDMFVPVQRANSEPVIKSNSYPYPAVSLSRCSQKSFSAPLVNTAGALRYPGDEPFVVIDHQIYPIQPIQNSLVHHQHGDFPNHSADANPLVSSRMLTGLSSAGF